LLKAIIIVFKKEEELYQLKIIPIEN